MERLTPDAQAFVERWGLVMEGLGGARTLGRMLGLLLLAERPLSLDDLARLLHVSKASVSTNGRLCAQIGMAQRVSLPGDRRTYYEISPGSFERALATRLRRVDDMLRLTEDGLTAIDDDNAAARERLEEMRDFYTFIGAEMTAALHRWEEEKRRRPASPS